MADKLSVVTESELVLIDGGDFHGEGICEAPVWHPDQYLTFVRHHFGFLYRWDPKSGTKLIRVNTGRTTGTVLDHQGRLVCCEGDNQRITRIDPGEYGNVPAGDWPKGSEVIADTFEGKDFNKPNDIIIRSDGTLYFTDPISRNRKNATEFPGVFMITPSGEVKLATNECERPNGLALSPDEKTLYVANSEPRTLRAMDVAADGSLSNNRVIATLDIEDEGNPDGMKVDTDGHCWVTSGGGVWVFEADGAFMGLIRTPGKPRNIGFGGPDYTTAYICSGEHMFSLETKVQGIPTFTG